MNQLQVNAAISYAFKHIENVLAGTGGSPYYQWNLAEVWMRRAEILMREGG